jgi:hypothetical protein
VAIDEVFHAAAWTPTREDGGVDEGLLLLLLGAVLAASVLLALGAARTGLPVLVAFLLLGMMLGSDGPGVARAGSSSTTRSWRAPSA